ncbi:MAG TPA: HAD family hydrolase [Dongiaceae bacterium]|nr:HAD family hydrolase [Dongiaceae bacterium]
MIRAVFFDVGETLVDETRQWISWADWLGVTPLTFCAALGAVIERGEHHRRVFDYFVPGLDIAAEDAKRRAAGKGYAIEARDLYPDALPTLAALKAKGLKIGIAGNQPERAEAALAQAGVTADYLASSERWGVEKPSPQFFARIAETAGLAPHQIAYVGDRLDNDVLPARAAGLFAVFLVRGPWGLVHARRPEKARASLVIDRLSDLPAALERAAGQGPG